MIRRPLLLACALLLAVPAAEAAARKKAPARVASAAKPIVLHSQTAAALISAYRAQYGLGPVALDGRLTQAAAYQARANAKSGTLSHEIGGSFRERMGRAGMQRGGYSAENLGAGRMSFEQMFAYWRGSSAHNANMLVPRFRRIGIAYVEAPGSPYGRFWAMALAD